MHQLKSLLYQKRRQLCLGGAVLVLGLIYYAVTQFTSFRIPCIFQTITGLACPGCGVSHFCIRLLHCDPAGAVRENLALGLLLPVWAVAGLIRWIWHPAWLEKNSKGEVILTWGSIALLLLFGVVRNLPGMEFLLPSYRM